MLVRINPFPCPLHFECTYMYIYFLKCVSLHCQKPSMLSKVSLLDSLDSTVGISRLATQKRKKERDLREASDEEKDEDEVKSRTGDDSRGFTGTGDYS